MEERIAIGGFETASELIETALYHYWNQEEMTEEELEELRREVQIGIDQADRGELIPMEEAFDILDKRCEVKP